MAEAGDVVLIAGKGHETGQDFGTHVEPFDDVEVARRALASRSRSAGPKAGVRRQGLEELAQNRWPRNTGPERGRRQGHKGTGIVGHRAGEVNRLKALLIAGGVALLVAILGTPLLIGEFRMRSIGQQIRVDGPAGHFSKAGTPTMGGLAIMGATVAGYIVAHVSATFTTRGLVGLLTICGAALVGFIDDWLKVTRQRSLGLNKRAKIAGQFVVAIAFAVVSVEWLKVDTHLSFTRFNSLGSTARQTGVGGLRRPRDRGHDERSKPD